MKTLYLFRHAETKMNITPDIVGGRSNHEPLTGLGEEQAVRLGHWISRRQLKPDVVYVSPAVRTIETARISLEAAGLVVEPVVDKRLQELSQGLAEGKPRKEIYTKEVQKLINRDLKDFKLEGGESMNDVAARKRSFSEYSRAVEEHDDIFVYTHGYAIRCYVGDLLGWSHAEIRANDHDNAAATILSFDNDGNLAGTQFNISTQGAYERNL